MQKGKINVDGEIKKNFFEKCHKHQSSERQAKMQSIKSYQAVLYLLCCLISALLFAFQGSVAAAGEEYVSVIVKSVPKGLSVDPVTLKRGATIIWVNSDKGDMTIKFITKLGIACKAPTNFYADLFGYYETTPIPEGGTASICFIDKGEYEYEVKRLRGKENPAEEIIPGKVIVKE